MHVEVGLGNTREKLSKRSSFVSFASSFRWTAATRAGAHLPCPAQAMHKSVRLFLCRPSMVRFL
jgi:hypothetical protein